MALALTKQDHSMYNLQDVALSLAMRLREC